MRTALLLGLTLMASVAFAAPSAEQAPATSAKKAKAGEACKSNADCDQSGRTQACMGGKCAQSPTPPPPT